MVKNSQDLNATSDLDQNVLLRTQRRNYCKCDMLTGPVEEEDNNVKKIFFKFFYCLNLGVRGKSTNF